MCLYTSHGTKPKVAEHDIICYKVVLCSISPISISGQYKYITPFRLTPFILDENGLFKAEGQKNVEEICMNRFEIGPGFIHTYKSLKEVQQKIGLGCNRVCFKCIIPKGTEYYNGVTDCCELDAYASEVIKVIKKVD